MSLCPRQCQVLQASINILDDYVRKATSFLSDVAQGLKE